MTRFDVVGRVATTSDVVVWKAVDRSLDRTVALKQIDGPSSAEARELAALSSRHVVKIYDVVEADRRTYLVEEWIDGATVRDIVRTSGALSTAHALAVIRGALLGLADVHAAGKVHGDVSPGNILVDTEGSSRLIDFGSVVTSGSSAQASTRSFASPEARSGRPLTPASDVYSAAAVLAMLLHGRSETDPSTLGVDDPVRGVLDKALATDPAARFPDAAAFLAALEDAARTRYGAAWWSQAGFAALVSGAAATVSLDLAGAPFATSAVGPARMRSRRTQVMAGGAGAAVIVAVVAVALASSGSKKKNNTTASTFDPARAAALSRANAASPAVATTDANGQLVFNTVSGQFSYRLVKQCDNCPPLSPSGSSALAPHPANATLFDGTPRTVNLNGADDKGSTLVVQGPLTVGTFARGSLPPGSYLSVGVSVPGADGSAGQIMSGSVADCSLTITAVGPTGVTGSASCPETHEPPPPAFEAPPGYTYAIDVTFSFTP